MNKRIEGDKRQALEDLMKKVNAGSESGCGVYGDNGDNFTFWDDACITDGTPGCLWKVTIEQL